MNVHLKDAIRHNRRQTTEARPNNQVRCHGCHKWHPIGMFSVGETVVYMTNRTNRETLIIGLSGRVVHYIVHRGLARMDIMVRIKLSKRRKVIVCFAPCELQAK